VERVEDPIGNLVCRSEVTAYLREVQHQRQFSPFAVTYTLGSQGKRWHKIATEEDAFKVLEAQRARHAPSATWQIWKDITKDRGFSLLPANKPDSDKEWLWLRVWHEEEEYWEETYHHCLEDLNLSLLRAVDFDIHIFIGIYACVHIEERSQEPEVEDKLTYLGIMFHNKPIYELYKTLTEGSLVFAWEDGTNEAHILHSESEEEVTFDRSVRALTKHVVTNHDKLNRSVVFCPAVSEKK
jgi:hypothetical protein